MKHPNFSIKRIILAVLTLTAIHSHAAESTEETAKRLPAVNVTADKDSNLEQKNTAGSRLGLSAKEIPASVESITSDTIRRRADTSVVEAVTRTTGLTDISTPGDGIAYSVRGFTGNNSIAVAEDGQRLLVGAGTITYPADTWGYERIEVLRGPASVMFGDASVGGVINAVRKQPTQKTSFDALLSLGNYENYQLGLGGGGALGESTSFRIDASAIGGKGYMDRGRFSSEKIMSTLRFNPTKNLEIDFGFDHAEQRPTRYFGTPLSNGSIDTSLRKENYNASDAVLNYKDDRVRNKISWQVNDAVKIKNELYAFNADRHWKNIETYELDAATQTVNRADYLEILHKQKQVGDRLDATIDGKIFGKNNRFVTGLEWAKVEFRHTNNSPYGGSSSVSAHNFDPGVFSSPDVTRPAFDTDTNNQAIFIENLLDLTQKLKLSAAIRKDYIEVKRDDLIGTADFKKKFSPLAAKLGIVYNVIPDLYLYVQGSSGSDPVTSIVSLNLANSSFDLTKARQGEVGIKQTFWNNRAEWTLAAFKIVKKDIITRDPLTPAISVQGGEQSSRGLEFTTSINPLKHWFIDFNAAVVDAKFDSLRDSTGASLAGKKPNNVPSETANLWTYYELGAWEAGVGLRYVGARWIDNANTYRLAPYTIADLNVSWHVNKNTVLRASVRNLTDRDYATTSYGSTQVMLGEPRHFSLIAEYSF